MNAMVAALRFARMLHGVLLFSMGLYVFVGEQVGPKSPRELGILPLAFGVLSLVMLGSALLARARMMGPAVDALRLRRDDSQALQRWRAGNILSFVMGETVALYGFALRVLGETLRTAAPFYAAGILVMLLWTPRLDVPEQG